ncbi:thiamine-phosphate kinase [Teredinibacter turnerae]|uniref:thiamine-phosphate kinase n=1 Tax=Teredinibacter turnerae TaxID=2426 RepID=UPI00037C2412|nr:thiamine-phosphate kinase [Teredinibacter turnerae]
MSLGEFDLIRDYFARAQDAPGVALGIGDDCALLEIPPSEQLAVSVDTLVADVHFPADAEPYLVAERALCVSLSDLAAMGAQPRWITLCLTLPAFDEAWLAGFSAGLFSRTKAYGCSLVGGDTTRGPLAISVQVMGTVPVGQALQRKGAQVGDGIYVSGPLGDGAAALALVRGELETTPSESAYLRERYFQPEPCFDWGHALRGIANAAIDVSDGLVQDLGHICSSSGVAGLVYLERLPFSAAVNRLDNTARYQAALAGGDDYQLCFTVPAGRQSALEELELTAFRIGDVVAGSGVRCQLNGADYPISKTGYQHFG